MGEIAIATKDVIVTKTDRNDLKVRSTLVLVGCILVTFSLAQFALSYSATTIQALLRSEASLDSSFIEQQIRNLTSASGVGQAEAVFAMSLREYFVQYEAIQKNRLLLLALLMGALSVITTWCIYIPYCWSLATTIHPSQLIAKYPSMPSLMRLAECQAAALATSGMDNVSGSGVNRI